MENKNDIKRRLIEKHLKKNIKVRIGEVRNSGLSDDKKFYFPVFNIKKPIYFFGKGNKCLDYLSEFILTDDPILKVVNLRRNKISVYNLSIHKKNANHFFERIFPSNSIDSFSFFVTNNSAKPLVENHGYLNDIAFETKEELIDFLEDYSYFYSEIIHN